MIQKVRLVPCLLLDMGAQGWPVLGINVNMATEVQVGDIGLSDGLIVGSYLSDRHAASLRRKQG